MIGPYSGKWNRGSPCVLAKPFVSGVESRAAIREGQWREISGEGERESDWETSSDAQWKFWSLIGHLIYWSYRGIGFRLHKGLPRPCLLCSLSFLLSVFQSLSPAALSVPLPITVSSSFSLCCPFFFSSLRTNTCKRIWQQGLIRISRLLLHTSSEFLHKY